MAKAKNKASRKEKSRSSLINTLKANFGGEGADYSDMTIEQIEYLLDNKLTVDGLIAKHKAEDRFLGLSLDTLLNNWPDRFSFAALIEEENYKHGSFTTGTLFDIKGSSKIPEGSARSKADFCYKAANRVCTERGIKDALKPQNADAAAAAVAEDAQEQGIEPLCIAVLYKEVARLEALPCDTEYQIKNNTKNIVNTKAVISAFEKRTAIYNAIDVEGKKKAVEAEDELAYLVEQIEIVADLFPGVGQDAYKKQYVIDWTQKRIETLKEYYTFDGEGNYGEGGFGFDALQPKAKFNAQCHIIYGILSSLLVSISDSEIAQLASLIKLQSEDFVAAIEKASVVAAIEPVLAAIDPSEQKAEDEMLQPEIDLNVGKLDDSTSLLAEDSSGVDG